jgi:hypothetical protein
VWDPPQFSFFTEIKYAGTSERVREIDVEDIEQIVVDTSSFSSNAKLNEWWLVRGVT